MNNNTEPTRDEILTAAANGNAAALEFLRCYARRAHWVDDLADADFPYRSEMPPPLKGVDVRGLASMEAEWLVCLSANQFFLDHRAKLVPAMVLALNAWVDSETQANPTVRDVVKGQWHEVVWLVAWLTGGWEHLRKTTGQHRSYDLEADPDAPVRINGKEATNGLSR